MNTGTSVALLLAAFVGIGFVIGSACEAYNAEDRLKEEARHDRCVFRCADLPVLYTKVVDGRGEVCGCGVER